MEDDVSNMTINCEFLAGTKIEDAITEASQKALNLDVAFVCFNFNGISFSISRKCDVHEALEEFRHGDKKYGIVN